MLQTNTPNRLMNAVSDTELAAEMKRRLAWAPQELSRRLSLHATNGVLYLEGIAGSEDDRDLIEALADSIPGRVGVYSRIVLGEEFRGQ